MISIEENIKTLERAVLDQAQAEAEKILAEARQKADDLRRQAREQASAERAKIIGQATLETERLHSQTIAITQLESRTIALEQREKLLLNVFETAREKLPEVQRDPDYGEIAQRLLREALLQLGAGSATVHADKATQKNLPPGLLERMSTELKMRIQVGKPLKDGIGVIVETGDGRRQYDNTLETRLKRIQDTLRSSVYRLLMGETR
ncbi:MAG TPA: V-type ATP synthase subunit E family protein [Anaerolineales bacterium]|nr:V-type ATP synthase subunit E family protein [Anaerolineales bacterium]